MESTDLSITCVQNGYIVELSKSPNNILQERYDGKDRFYVFTTLVSLQGFIEGTVCALRPSGTPMEWDEVKESK